MEPRNILILTAITLEAKALAKMLQLRRISEVRWRGELGRSRITLNIVGMNARHWPALVTTGAAYQAVILAGVAGGLDPNLHIGSVLIDEESTPIPAYRHLPPTLDLRVGKIHSADAMIATPASKHHLYTSTGAHGVEMERSRVLRHMDAMPLPRPAFLHIRGISDSAHDSLDSSFTQIVDPLGRVRPLSMTATLVRRPNLIPRLWRTGHNAHLAATRAAAVVRAILITGWPVPSSP